VSYLIEHSNRYLAKTVRPEDVLSIFAGIRPLVAPPDSSGNTSDIARDHQLYVSDSGLVTISGGKWTTYRQMAEDTINRASEQGNLPVHPSVSSDLTLHGAHPNADQFGDLAPYGSDATALQELMQDRPSLAEPLDDRLPIRGVQVVWAVRHEMARTVEDVLARRTRCLLLDAQASIDVAPQVATLMAQELGEDDSWVQNQVAAYEEVAQKYLMTSSLVASDA
jgi:glycerol-3-phosphate dehydrogenase